MAKSNPKMRGFKEVLEKFCKDTDTVVDITAYFKKAGVTYGPENNLGGYRQAAMKEGFKLKVSAKPFYVKAANGSIDSPDWSNPMKLSVKDVMKPLKRSTKAVEAQQLPLI